MPRAVAQISVNENVERLLFDRLEDQGHRGLAKGGNPHLRANRDLSKLVEFRALGNPTAEEILQTNAARTMPSHICKHQPQLNFWQAQNGIQSLKFSRIYKADEANMNVIGNFVHTKNFCFYTVHNYCVA